MYINCLKYLQNTTMKKPLIYLYNSDSLNTFVLIPFKYTQLYLKEYRNNTLKYIVNIIIMQIIENNC